MTDIEKYNFLKERIELDIYEILRQFEYELVCDALFTMIDNFVSDYLRSLKAQAFIEDIIIRSRNSWKLIFNSFINIYIDVNYLDSSNCLEVHVDMDHKDYFIGNLYGLK